MDNRITHRGEKLQRPVNKVAQAKRRAAQAKRLAAMNMCRWFALCDNPATETRSHTILGNVPICERCSRMIKAMERV